MKTSKLQKFFQHDDLPFLIIAKVCSAHCSTSRLAPGSPGCRLFVRHHAQNTTFFFDDFDHANHTFSESSRSENIKIDIPKCLIHKDTNTNTDTNTQNTQIHKYSIRARKTQHAVYF